MKSMLDEELTKKLWTEWEFYFHSLETLQELGDFCVSKSLKYKSYYDYEIDSYILKVKIPQELLEEAPIHKAIAGIPMAPFDDYTKFLKFKGYW